MVRGGGRWRLLLSPFDGVDSERRPVVPRCARAPYNIRYFPPASCSSGFRAFRSSCPPAVLRPHHHWPRGEAGRETRRSWDYLPNNSHAEGPA